MTIDYEKIRQREVNRINDLRKQEALARYHATIKYNITHQKKDNVPTIPGYETMDHTKDKCE